MLKIIQNWLAKPSGRYFDGLVIFAMLASADIKKKYEAYFREIKEEPKQHDIHFTMLINKVVAIENAVKTNPKAYEDIELVFKETGPDAASLAIIAEKTAKIEELKTKIQQLKSENTEIISENEDLNTEIADLESELEDAKDEVSEYEVELESLEKDVEALKAKRGLQIVALKDMPDDIRKVYERNQEITPLMASYHTQIAVEGLNANTRKSLVKKLCALDDERRQNWDTIETWSEGKETTDFTVEVPAYSDDLVIAGAQMARRIERLKENIIRSKEVAEKSDKETIKANAEKRIAAYELELSELTAKLNPVTEAESKGADE